MYFNIKLSFELKKKHIIVETLPKISLPRKLSVTETFLHQFKGFDIFQGSFKNVF